MKPIRIYANVVVSLQEFYRNKATMFFVLLFPILLILLFGFIFQDTGETVYDLHVQNNDGKLWSREFTDALNDTGLFNVHMVGGDEEPYDYIEDHDLNTMLVIPAGYSDDINTTLGMRAMGLPVNGTVNMTIIYDPGNSVTATKMSILSSVVDGLNKGLSGAEDTVGIEVETTLSDRLEFIDFFAPGIIAMSVMTTALFGTVGMNTELRQKGIMRKLATTPMTRAEWILSNVIYQLCMAALSTAAILIIGNLVFGLEPSINLFLPIFVLLDVFAFSGIGMLITRFVKDAESAQAAANAIMFPMMFLAGTFFALEMMPDFLQTLAKVLPLYYVNEGLRDAMIGADWTGAAYNAIVIGIFGIVVFVIGIFLTSWKEE